MKRLVFLFLAVLFISAGSYGQAPTPSDQNNAEAEVMKAIAKWADAVRSRDMKALDALFADELFITTFDGKTRGKKEELEVLKPNPNVRTVSVENEDVRVKLYGETAVVTALTKMQFVISEKETPVAMRYTAVFVKRDGRWQMVALQTART
ncbi:MAG: nuclear transport factor 2 family protein [Acidobacteria bacterium]|nr:nuclear transport factor 2 family protein [Acidobacteriota bacterium]